MKDLRTSTTVTEFPPPERRRRDDHHHVIVRPLPKYVFLYPTFFATLLMGIVVNRMPEHEQSAALVFLAVLFLNLLVLAVDFARSSAVALAFAIVSICAVGMLINLNAYEFLPSMLDFGGKLSPAANDQFYFTIAGAMAIIYAIVFLIDVRMDYWEIMPNEIIHHHGVFDSVQRFPAPGLTMQKDITDVFELLLLRSGRLVIHPSQGADIILENVPHINRVERQIQTLLEAMSVQITDPQGHWHARSE